ncbi:MAG: hypothetical protein DA407_11385 [Bacteroidetes bacterium]|nr:MAG: hypothetical protein DA407_11385 [Bacteroidota bacterium]
MCFYFFLLIHGVIHLIGFFKAFQLTEITQLTQHISKPIGILWLFTALLFVFSTVLFLFKKEWWFVIAMAAVTLSQILIIVYWQEAKFGTIANVIILMISISAYGNYQFNKMIRTEIKLISQNIQVKNLPVVSKVDINHLPEIVQDWMINSGVVGNEKINSVWLKQTGEMKTKPEGKRMPFTASQYFNIDNTAFIWKTNVDAFPIVKMVGRDKLYNGEGEMLIKLASLIPVVNEGKNDKINQGAMIRFLAETCWFPSAVINDYVTWEAINSTSAKATLTINDKSASGVFSFSTEGNLVSFEADRYFGGKDDSKLEKWFVKMDNYKVFNGIKIPNKCSVVWKLKEGDFNWLNLEIVNLEFNNLY